jgi:hypothetical protein
VLAAIELLEQESGEAQVSAERHTQPAESPPRA